MARRNASVTKGRAALELFTDRHSLILAFTEALSQDPPPGEVFFFEGGGGNGKSLLLWFLEKHCCKRFSDWERRIRDVGTDERMRRLIERTAYNRPGIDSVPSARIDFGAPLSEFEQPKVAYDALMMLRRDLGPQGFDFPLYDFAAVWYLKQRNMMTEERLKGLVPADELGFFTAIADVVSKTSWGSLAGAVIGLFDKHIKERGTLWWMRQGSGEKEINEIMGMDPTRELLAELPYYFG